MGRHRLEEQENRAAWGGPELLAGRDPGPQDAHAAAEEEPGTGPRWPGETGRAFPEEGSTR
ncbi:hypothetical protein [Amycolatopsis aidingensis]|uniref:hypothetical protein n=1 Tax=Amycolatopsis aidingensis TaxID=2842453 RepID=UPI001C0DD799|nr:hypothetical protein [Amycolatopsis aidingensis]